MSVSLDINQNFVVTFSQCVATTMIPTANQVIKLLFTSKITLNYL